MTRSRMMIVKCYLENRVGENPNFVELFVMWLCLCWLRIVVNYKKSVTNFNVFSQNRHYSPFSFVIQAKKEEITEAPRK